MGYTPNHKPVRRKLSKGTYLSVVLQEKRPIAEMEIEVFL